MIIPMVVQAYELYQPQTCVESLNSYWIGFRLKFHFFFFWKETRSNFESLRATNFRIELTSCSRALEITHVHMVHSSHIFRHEWSLEKLRCFHKTAVFCDETKKLCSSSARHRRGKATPSPPPRSPIAIERKEPSPHAVLISNFRGKISENAFRRVRFLSQCLAVHLTQTLQRTSLSLHPVSHHQNNIVTTECHPIIKRQLRRSEIKIHIESFFCWLLLY